MNRKVDLERVLDQFTELVSVDSVSLGERQMADILKAELESLGFEVTEDDAGAYFGSDTGNLYGLLTGTDPGREPVLLSAHMDTVEPGLGKRAIVDRSSGMITSAGDTVLGADDLSGVAEILEGIRLAKEDPAGHGDVEVLFTVAEESYCKGAAKFDFSRIRSKAAYIADMSGSVGNAAVSAPSIISFEFTIHGKPAHAGFDPGAGINAIAAAAEIISQTEQGLIGIGLTLNIGTIEGGKASNIVSDSCRCTGEVRGSDHEEAVRVLGELEKRIESVCSRTGAEHTFRSEVRIRAYCTPEDDITCRTFLKACENLGLEGKLISTRSGSDNNVFAEHGISGIVLSSGMMDTHSVTEHIEIRDLEMGSRLIAEIIALS